MEIKLDGKVKATLNWTSEMALAREVSGKILWNLDLGLFKDLQGLTEPMQYQALTLALDHFRDTIWKEFSEKSEGVILYDGQADLSLNFPWDGTQKLNYQEWLEGKPSSLELQSLYCVKAATDYLSLLVQRMPDAIPLIVRMDAGSIANPFLKVSLLNPENYSHFQMWISSGGYAVYQTEKLAKVGICLPATKAMEPTIRQLEKMGIFYRVIPENELITQWDGLDEIFYDPKLITPQGKRKLQGFLAAGGLVTSVSACN